MNIIPISSTPVITPFKTAFAPEKTQETGSFKGLFEDAVSNLESLNETKNEDGIALALGNIDDIGQMQVNSEKAEVSLQMLVQMRNKILDSYSEIMRMNV